MQHCWRGPGSSCVGVQGCQLLVCGRQVCCSGGVKTMKGSGGGTGCRQGRAGGFGRGPFCCRACIGSHFGQDTWCVLVLARGSCVCARRAVDNGRQGECVIGLAGWQAPKRMPSMRQQLQHCMMMRQQHQRCLLVAGTDGQCVFVCVLFVGTSSFLPNCCCRVFRLSVVRRCWLRVFCGPVVAAACHSSTHVCMLPGVAVVDWHTGCHFSFLDACQHSEAGTVLVQNGVLMFECC